MRFANLRWFKSFQQKKQHNQQQHPPSLQLPLSLVLTLPFMLLTVGTTGLVGYLCIRDGEQAVIDLSHQLMSETADRVDLYLTTYLRTPQRVNRVNANAVQLGQIDIADPESLQRHFVQQIQVFDSVSRIHFSYPQGGYVAAGNDERGLTIATTNGLTQGTLQVYSVDQQGNRKEQLVNQPNYDASQRPFYQRAVAIRQPVWTPVYRYVPASRGLGISASYPLYDAANRLQGVLASDLTLVAIRQYLEKLDIGKDGTVFIMDRAGTLVAASTDEAPLKADPSSDETKLLKAIESQNLPIRSSTQRLIDQFGDLKQINAVMQLQFYVEGKQHFLQVMPFKDQFGLDWLIVVTVSETAFMSQIAANTHHTVGLSIAALMGAILLGLLLAHWIARSIQRLGRASQALAQGEWTETLKQNSPIAELQVLANSFHQTAQQLQQSFERAKTALQESEEKFAKVFRTCPDAIGIVTLDGRYVEVNDAFVNLFGYSREEVLGHKAAEIGYWVNFEERQRYVQAIRSGEQIRNQEYRFCTRTGDQLTVLFSADSIELQEQLYLIGIAKDITSRKQAEAALQQSETRLQSLAATAPVNIYSLVQHPDGSIQFEYVNRVVEEFHEVSLEEFLRDPATIIMEQMHPEDRQGYLDGVARSAATLERFQYEWRVITPSGKLRWLQARSQPERRPNGDICWHGVVLDISDRKVTEEALRHSEAALRRAQQVAHVGSWEVDLQTEQVTWSEESFHIFGWDTSQTEPSVSEFYELIHPDDRLHVQRAVTRTIDDGSPYKIEFRIICSDGSLRYVEARGEAIRNEQGQVVQLLGTNLDITERYQAEEALRLSEATKNQILKAIPDLIIWMTADGICIDLIDGGAITNLYNQSEVIGVNLYEMLPAELAQARMKAIQQALQTGEMQIYEQEVRLQDSVQYEEVRVIGVGDDRILVIVRNITDHKLAETALLDSEARFRSAFWNAPIGMALIGLDDRWLKVNPMLCEMLGTSESDLLSITASSMIHPEDIDKLRQCYEQVQLNETRNIQVELRYCCHAGRLVWGLLSLSLVRDAQKQPCYYVAQIQDITEQHAVDQMKNEFISIVSHELRTPLTAIRGFLGLLDTGIYDNKPDKAKHMIRQALTNSDRLVRLVNDILDLERLTSGRVELVMEVCEAQDLMQRAVAGLQSIADAASVTLLIERTNIQVWAAPDSVIQTLTNLIGNAIKFSPANSVVTLLAQPQPDFALFQVKDQGRGIPADKLEAIFGRFQQVDVSDARQKGGTGLGLAICQSIIEQHGGNIWAESSLGQGSTFYFTLPLPKESEKDER
jgi:PAS domain S-box-containing protein